MVILGANTTVAMSAGDNSSNVIKVDEQDHYHEDWIPPFQFRYGICIKTNEKFSDYYELHEEIGEGKFGKVYRCVEQSTGLVLAAKCIRLKRDADLQKVEKEVNIMTQMRHKCIAQIYDAFATSTSNDVILIMEIVQGGELFDRVVDESYILTEMAVAMIVHQICEAIRYIHSQNIIHLDLKPENIMCVSQTGNQIKLIDFGLAQYFDGQSDLLFMAGTPEFAAPEVIKYEPLDFHTDMWSVGVITYILLSGQSPFLGENIAHTYCNVERGKWDFCEEFRENCITPEAHDFISRLLVIEKHKRMLPDECLRHPWITLFRERSRNANRPAERPLDVGKLRSYVRNKRFRRLVFGVLFINTIVRMMNTLQDRRSDHGMRYMKDMLGAVQTDPNAVGQGAVGSNDVSTSSAAAADIVQPVAGAGILMKSLFTKTKLKPESADDTTINESRTDVNNSANKLLPTVKSPATTPIEQFSDLLASTSEKEMDAASSPRPQRCVLKSKRVKSDSRKASSTEQAPEKRTKTSTPTAEHALQTSKASQVEANESEISSANRRKSAELFNENKSTNYGNLVVSKLKNLAMFEKKAGPPLQMSVTAAAKCSITSKKAVGEVSQINEIKKDSPAKSSSLSLKLIAFVQNTTVKSDENKDETRQKILSAKKVKKPNDGTDTLAETDRLALPSTFKARSSSPLAVSQRTAKVVAVKKSKEEGSGESMKETSSTSLTTNKTHTKLYNTANIENNFEAISKSKDETTGGGNNVSSLLRKLENNRNEGCGGITMAVTGYVPPNLVTIRRHGSAENLNGATGGENGELRQKYYKRQGPHKTINIASKLKNENCLPSSKKLTLQVEHKAIQRQKTTIKTNLFKSTTSTSIGVLNENENEKKKSKDVGVIVDETTSELASIRRNLRSVVTTPQSYDPTFSEGAKTDPSSFNSGAPNTSELIATFNGRLSRIASEKTTQMSNKEGENFSTEVSEKTINCKKSAQPRQKEVAGQRVVQCAKIAATKTKKVVRKSSKASADLLESVEIQTDQKVMAQARNFNSDEASQSSRRTKKVIIKPKAKIVMRPSDAKSERKKGAFSLNDLSQSDKSDAKNVKFSHDPLMTEMYDWQLKRASDTGGGDKNLATKTDAAGRPKSEDDLSKRRKSAERRSSSKSRSSHRPSDNFSFEYDAFDFSALRLKLQQRILGATVDDYGGAPSAQAPAASSRLKCELRVQLPDAGLVMKTRNKWLDMDKATTSNSST